MNSNDDLWYALDYNQPSNFTKDDVIDILAEVPGENDELSWWWILQLKDNRFALLEAWCDYTGWDCQSGIYTEEIHQTATECAEASPEIDNHSNRTIRKNLINQLNGTQPKFLYTE